MTLGFAAIGRMLLVAAVGAALLLGSVESAQAHHNDPGTHVAKPVECYSNVMTVRPPQMYAAGMYVNPGFAIIGGNTQTVAFRPHLAQYFPGVGWRTIQDGIWKKSVARDVEIGVYSWTTLDGRTTDASHSFSIPQAGTYQAPIFYAVWTEYYWYADQSHHGGSTWSWNPHHENRASAGNQKTYWGCKYPGPNDVTMIG